MKRVLTSEVLRKVTKSPLKAGFVLTKGVGESMVIGANKSTYTVSVTKSNVSVKYLSPYVVSAAVLETSGVNCVDKITAIRCGSQHNKYGLINRGNGSLSIRVMIWDL